ncbi:MAG: hypothetical protein HQ464_04640 [Planctomycetes bacterium]|nr:hypothetical protein [Planctomycetota bacterium]
MDNPEYPRDVVVEIPPKVLEKVGVTMPESVPAVTPEAFVISTIDVVAVLALPLNPAT